MPPRSLAIHHGTSWSNKEEAAGVRRILTSGRRAETSDGCSDREQYRLARAAPKRTRPTSAMLCRQKSYVMPSENACGLVPVKQPVPLPIRLIPGLAVKVGVPPSLQSHVTPCPPGPKA